MYFTQFLLKKFACPSQFQITENIRTSTFSDVLGMTLDQDSKLS